MNDLYNSLAHDYDTLHPKEEIYGQKAFFEILITEYAIKDCLDCACGTGWHLSLFSELGLDCFGSDISPKMLDKAKINLSDKNISLMQEDFRTLSHSWKQRFDMVVCLTTSLPHMLTDEDVVTGLNSMYERLNENGILVISNGISDKLLDEKPKFIPARIHDNQAFYFFLEYPTSKRVMFNILQVQRTTNSFEHTFTAMDYYAMRQSTLDACFQKTNFSKVDYFGGFDFKPYSKVTSGRLIVIAQR